MTVLFWQSIKPYKNSMPKIPTACQFPACPKVSWKGHYCTEHATSINKTNRETRETNDATLRESQEFYQSTRWRKLRNWFIKQNPICLHCGRPAQEIDHIQPIRQGGSAMSVDNLQSLCTSCHAIKSNKEKFK